MFGSSKSSSATSPSVMAGIDVQTSIAGVPVQIVYGSNRISGNLIWYGNFQAIQGSSGAGKGGVSSKGNGNYTYRAAFLLALCQGPVVGANQVWASKSTSQSFGAFDLGFIYGTFGQPALGFLDVEFPGQNLGYSGLCYVASPGYDLGSSAELPNFNFEIQGILAGTGGPYGDADPGLVIADFLTNPYYGANFPPQYLGDLTVFSQYCVAQSLYISPIFNESQDAASLLDDIANSCNSAFVWSGGLLNLVPYGDLYIEGQGSTYTPPTQPLFSLTDDDFIFDQSADPVTIERARPADQENCVSLEYLNRENAYNPDLVWARDEASVALYGQRQSSSPASCHYFCMPPAAQTSINLQLARKAIRNQYTFKLGWRYCMLDPMDIVAITDERLGITEQWVRVLEVSEDEWTGKDGGTLTIKAEEYLQGTGATALYNFQQGSGYQPNYNAPAPAVFAPAFVEPTFQLTGGDPELWVALAGPNGSWGGADIWVSLDGATYVHLTSVQQSARYGVTTTNLAADVDGLDLNGTLGVDLTISQGALEASPGLTASQANTSLCAVGDEFLSYASTHLTSGYSYTLTGLNRGQYDTEPLALLKGAQFVRCDDTLIKIPLQPTLIGKTVSIKVLSKNAWGIGQPTLDEVEPYTYKWLGLAYTEALPALENLSSVYQGSIQTLTWTPVDDNRQPGYEIRSGINWGLGIPVGETSETSYIVNGNGTFWVAAKYVAPTGYIVYGAPASVTISGAIIIQNLLESFDEASTGWTGTCTGTAIVGGNLQLAGSGNILATVNILAEVDILNFGGLSVGGGTYTVPSSHIIDAQRVTDVGVAISWSAEAVSIYDNLLTAADLLSVSDILGTDNGPTVSVTPQIQVAQATGGYSAWQNFTPGRYSGQYFNFQLVLNTSDPTVNCIVTDFAVMTDVPDLIYTGTNVSVSSSGLTVTYPTPFNNTPNVQVTIESASAGDDVILTKTTGGFTVQIMNAGSGVARTIDWAAQGF